MKTQQRTWKYLTLIAVVAVGFSCNTSKQTAQTGEADDLYGNSGNAVVYADNSPNQAPQQPAMARTGSSRNAPALRRNNRNANPDYTDDQQPYSANQDEYYSELSTRNVNRGISADPGWGGNGNGSGTYNDGFTNGYNAGLNNPAYNSSRWNPWGYNNSLSNGFNIGLGLGAGLYGYNSFGSPFGYSRFGFGNSFGYSPFGYGGGYGYSPFGYGGGYYDPFHSSYGYGGYGGYGGYSPFGYGYSSFGYGGGYGYGGYNSPVYVNNNVIVSGADPYRNTRTYGARGGSSNGRYNDGFVNSTPNTTNGGRSSATGSYNPSSSYGNRNSSGTANSDSYYASPRQNSRSNSGYYYGNDNTGNGRSAATGNSTYSPPASSNSGSGDYYARPRQNGSSYTPADGGSRGNGGYSNGSGRSSYQQAQPSYQQSQPTYQQRSYQQSQSQPSYQQSQPSYSAPSYNSGGSRGSSGGGFSGGGGGSSGGGSSSGGGGGRGPR